MKHVCSKRQVTECDYGYICDSCNKEIEDTQETLHWKMRGGFGSIFGDGAEMTLDLCQECIKTRLGDAIQFHGNAYFDTDLDEP